MRTLSSLTSDKREAQKVYELSLNAEGFVIPNSASSLVDIFSESTKKRMTELHKDISANHELTELNEEHFVQIWLLNNVEQYGFTSENWNDHGLHARVGSKVLLLYPMLDRLPISLFDGKQEGDYVEFSTTCNGYAVDVDGGDEKIIAKINIKLKLNQLDYRYKRFGRFEDVINYLTPAKLKYAEV